MNLYKYEGTTVAPGENVQEAMTRFQEEVDNIVLSENDFRLILPSDAYMKVFRLGRMLYEVDQFNSEEVEAIVLAYTKKLGYDLTKEELWDGVLKWVERTLEYDDEELDKWMNK